MGEVRGAESMGFGQGWVPLLALWMNYVEYHEKFGASVGRHAGKGKPIS